MKYLLIILALLGIKIKLVVLVALAALAIKIMGVPAFSQEVPYVVKTEKRVYIEFTTCPIEDTSNCYTDSLGKTGSSIDEICDQALTDFTKAAKDNNLILKSFRCVPRRKLR